MEQIAIAKFKVSCLAILERVRKWRLVLVTRFGQPMVQVIPPTPPKRPARRLGSLAHTGRIRGDIVASVSDERDWSVFRF